MTKRTLNYIREILDNSDISEDEVLSEMRRLYEINLWALNGLADRYQVAASTIRYWLVDAGTPIRDTCHNNNTLRKFRKFTNDNGFTHAQMAEKMQYMYEQQKLSLREIGDKIGVSFFTIKNILNEYGVKLRSRGGCNNQKRTYKRKHYYRIDGREYNIDELSEMSVVCKSTLIHRLTHQHLSALEAISRPTRKSLC
jgi:hypothetical protein